MCDQQFVKCTHLSKNLVAILGGGLEGEEEKEKEKEKVKEKEESLFNLD